MKSVILIELKLPEYEVQQPYVANYGSSSSVSVSVYDDCYEVLGVVNISDELKKGDSFIFRFNETNKHVKILTNETIYTTSNNLDLYLVWDVSSVERIQETIKQQRDSHLHSQLGQNPVYSAEPINYDKIVSDSVNNFRKDLVNDRININYKSFDRKNKIEGVLNS